MSRYYEQIAKNLRAVIEDTPYEGEREAAKNQLKKILAKLAMTEEELCDSVREWRVFRIHRNHRKLAEQIAAYYLPTFLSDFDSPIKIFVSGPNKGHLSVFTTEEELIELAEIYEFFYKAYNRQLKIFYKAFIQANRLYIAEKPGSKSVHIHRLPSEEDLSIVSMAASMESFEFHSRNKPSGEIRRIERFEDVAGIEEDPQ